MWLQELFSKANSYLYQDQTMLALGALSVWAGWGIGKKFGWIAGSLFVWAIWEGIRISWWTVSPQGFDQSRFLVFSLGAVRAQVTVLLLAGLAGGLTGRLRDDLLGVFAVLGLVSSLSLIVLGQSILVNTSMDAALVACLLPLLFRYRTRVRYLAVLPVIAVLKTGSSTGVLALALAFAPLVPLRRLPYFLVAASVTVWLAPLNHALLYSNGRTALWELAWNFYTEHGFTWRGFGLGTFGYHAAYMQHAASENGQWQNWIWMHNDWLQIGFELGALGLLLSLLMYGAALLNSLTRPWLASAVMTFGFCMLTQPLIVHMVPAVYAVLLLHMTLRRPHGA